MTNLLVFITILISMYTVQIHFDFDNLKTTSSNFDFDRQVSLYKNSQKDIKQLKAKKDQFSVEK